MKRQTLDSVLSCTQCAIKWLPRREAGKKLKRFSKFDQVQITGQVPSARQGSPQLKRTVNNRNAAECSAKIVDEWLQLDVKFMGVLCSGPSKTLIGEGLDRGK